VHAADQPPAGHRKAIAPSAFLPTLTPTAVLSLLFISLIAAHYIIIVEYSLPLITLRVVSILAPLDDKGFMNEKGETVFTYAHPLFGRPTLLLATGLRN